MTDSSSPLFQPTPRRRFEFTPTSTDSSAPPTPTRHSSYLDLETSEAKRTRSILNLTSSTLFGIYSPSGDENARGGLSTPWSMGAQTPARPPNASGPASPITSAFANPKPQKTLTPQRQPSARDSIPPLVLRVALLFCSGMAYGLIVRHLHDRQQLAPVRINQIDRNSWRYLMLWGGGGVILGALMPWVDIYWEEALRKDEKPEADQISPDAPIAPISTSEEGGDPSLGSRNRQGENWDTVVRVIGAFIGIAFAIRRLPWQSTLQVSLTLAFLNPVLWYLIDRSKPGFCLSAFIGVIGTAVVLGVNPDLVPPPTSSLSNVLSNVSIDNAINDGLMSNESIGVWTWMASVLFCSTLCFGNIGRRLSLGHAGRKAKML